ncbi:MAG: DUF2242 domain-containing protein, partial [Deltaproteobacteria bacterium]|nr:DUF2242 domain-containing protein [Deltaproteobacteria bacterium]
MKKPFPALRNPIPATSATPALQSAPSNAVSTQPSSAPAPTPAPVLQSVPAPTGGDATAIA